MAARRTLARIALVGTAPLLFAGSLTAPAHAHGALDNPVSRVVACGPDGGGNARSAACRAAAAVSGALPFTNWDNLRVPNVRGRDRDVIPDGKLCSGGLPAYHGLDLPRADWPATRLRAGASFRFTYRETIPHQGTFRLYLTKDGYDPTKPLKWSDLDSTPFLTATDPPLAGDAYVMRGALPAGRTGHHLIYTVWQNSSTPDTYYSCSDVIFEGTGGAGAAKPEATGAPSPVTEQATEEAAPQTPTQEPSGVAARTVALTPTGSASSALPLAAGSAAAFALIAGVGAFFLRRRGTTPGSSE